MEYRSVPGTALSVSEIGFGCGGNAGLMLRGSRQEQVRTITRAAELGINYFDNAPDYGDGLAEENLGVALRETGCPAIVTTKVEVRAGDLDDIARHVVCSLEASLKRLGRDTVDIVQIHNGPAHAPHIRDARDYAQLSLDNFLGFGGALEGLRRVVEAGKARYAGFICRGEDGDEVRALLDTGFFRMINVPYTLLNPSAGMAVPAGLGLDRDYGNVLDYARERQCGAAIYSPLAGGVLAGAGQAHPLARGPRDERASAWLRAMMASFDFLDVKGTHTRAQAAFRFSLAHCGVSTVIGGFSDVAQMEELVATSGAGALPKDTLARIAQVWARNFHA